MSWQWTLWNEDQNGNQGYPALDWEKREYWEQGNLLIGAIVEIFEGLHDSNLYENIYIDEVDYRKIDYPCVQILPGRTSETGNYEYSQPVDVIFYYEKALKGGKDTRLVEILDEVGEAEYYIEERIKTSDFVGPYKMDSAEPYAPFEAGNNRLLPILMTVEYKMIKGGC